MNPVKSPSSPPHCRSVEPHAAMSNTFPPWWIFEWAGGVTRTFALHPVGGAVEVCGCVSRTGHAVVLAKLRLVGASGTADAAVGAGVVVVSWRALDCKGTKHSQAKLTKILVRSF